MSDLTKLIKDLRNKTGAGFLDCKNALIDNNNDIEKAVEQLRKKGLAKAAKKISREATEGAIGIFSNDNQVVILKMNSETDFAAKSETFLNYVDYLGEAALSLNNINLTKDEFLKSNYKDTNIKDSINAMIAKIGENLILNDLISFSNDNYFNYYIHNSYKANIGKIISYIRYNASEKNNNVDNFSKNLCMHIAAMKPESLDIEDLDSNIVEKEKIIQKDLIQSSGKPSKIIDKILDGKMKKFYSEITLLNQTYILDQEKSVKNIIEDFSKETEFKILSFDLISLN